MMAHSSKISFSAAAASADVGEGSTVPSDLVVRRDCWERITPSGEPYLRVFWNFKIEENSDLMDDVVRQAASRWDVLARKLTTGHESRLRAFTESDISGFEEQKGQAKRCRTMLIAWLRMSITHNYGALYTALHAAGLGRLADEKLGVALGIQEVYGQRASTVDGGEHENDLHGRRSTAEGEVGHGGTGCHGGRRSHGDGTKLPAHNAGVGSACYLLPLSYDRYDRYEHNSPVAMTFSSPYDNADLQSSASLACREHVTGQCSDVTEQCSDVTEQCSDVTVQCSDVTVQCSDVTEQCSDVTAAGTPPAQARLDTGSMPRGKCFSNLTDWDLDLLTPDLEALIPIHEQRSLANGLLCSLLRIRSGAEYVQEQQQLQTPVDSFLKCLLRVWSTADDDACARTLYLTMLKVRRAEVHELRTLLQL